MSVSFSMGFSCGCGDHDHFEKAESEVALIIDHEGSRAENRHKGPGGVVDLEMEFWPLEHPMEPQDEDRPVKCPMPAPSSIINIDGRVREDALMKRREKKEEEDEDEDEDEEKEKEEGRGNKAGKKMVCALPPTGRSVRKRHHRLTHEYDDPNYSHHVIKPLTRMPPHLPTHNITIYQMLQQLDKFDS